MSDERALLLLARRPRGSELPRGSRRLTPARDSGTVALAGQEAGLGRGPRGPGRGLRAAGWTPHAHTNHYPPTPPPRASARFDPAASLTQTCPSVWTPGFLAERTGQRCPPPRSALSPARRFARCSCEAGKSRRWRPAEDRESCAALAGGDLQVLGKGAPGAGGGAALCGPHRRGCGGGDVRGASSPLPLRTSAGGTGRRASS